MLGNKLYDFLDHILTARPVFYPHHIKFPFPDGYEPIHLKCYRTARKVNQFTGHPVIAGVTFLDKDGRLYPWPHMVNAIGATLAEGLIDASPVVDQPNLGFIPVSSNETVAWNEITTAYTSLMNAAGSSWGDPNADLLTSNYLPRLRDHASLARSSAMSFAIPDSIGEG